MKLKIICLGAVREVCSLREALSSKQYTIHRYANYRDLKFAEVMSNSVESDRIKQISFELVSNRVKNLGKPTRAA